jgi:hypothetical protein
MKRLASFIYFWAAIVQLHAQGYIVPNGVMTNLFPGEIDVWNPNGSQATGFILTPIGKQQPTFYTNVFEFDEPVTIGVRVFLVQANDAISLQPILDQSWIELGNAPSYVFANGVPFYVGLYTGYNFAPPYPPFPPYYYTDPIFGWAQLVNNHGVIQVLNYAVEYQGAGIYAGTQNIIPTPEPSAFALTALGGLLLGCRRWKTRHGVIRRS